MKPIVAIFAQGTMGAGLARVLTRHGAEVVTALEGRSAESAVRARGAGMRDVPFAALWESDMVLSVLPPAEALPFARRLAASAAGRPPPLYVDCNAVSPRTLHEVERAARGAGCDFSDVGIIGLPPGTAATAPRLYAAGGGAALDLLREHGLDLRRLSGPPGTASALKMSYAGITKGLIAVASAMALGAMRAGVGESLARELSASEPQLLDSLSRRIPDMLPKAYRWVAEMREIADFLGEDPGAAAMYEGAAELYACIAADAAGPRKAAGALGTFVAQAAGFKVPRAI